ncbi:hypothetical protein CROQUDRAFT_86314 [Cronartium quercuum f. sp. fusiforme G11]|uniref:Uncharacterized protein n=1 Tax=Cronartium quercuum f. sp. fusiforme G11 TaxID=708437 RepID=A0A9P6NWJ1_9BASI|nr:hypothetical protein CROQUDRAFT_86314 [Cronartium quercuum f. sp. fusiforme G11]
MIRADNYPNFLDMQTYLLIKRELIRLDHRFSLESPLAIEETAREFSVTSTLLQCDTQAGSPFRALTGSRSIGRTPVHPCRWSVCSSSSFAPISIPPSSVHDTPSVLISLQAHRGQSQANSVVLTPNLLRAFCEKPLLQHYLNRFQLLMGNESILPPSHYNLSNSHSWRGAVI